MTCPPLIITRPLRAIQIKLHYKHPMHGTLSRRGLVLSSAVRLLTCHYTIIMPPEEPVIYVFTRGSCHLRTRGPPPPPHAQETRAAVMNLKN
ncbi:hypothetical protein AVEN_93883-1 [Araneus ventricosus]|uniref:Uncharacterized protein n=1 Tax=Araneus ventricosus TaxID=182803 RepID=A0A4Y2AXT1_ARAVE|nr:hypothetical protein AVEN_93883-1 [Araneus ventricosus]